MSKTIPFLIALWFVTATASPAHAADEPFFLEDASARILFLGDSITQAGRYIDDLDAYPFTRFPDREHTLINLGLSSETVSGLTEPNHPYPRPNLHDRLDQALQLTRPDIVVVCYGMNDGIYHPFSEERFAAYQAGINKVIEKAHAAGTKVVLMTPPPFDPVPIAEKLVGLGAPAHGYSTPYRDYDSVLGRYARWIMKQKDRVALTVDLHTALNDHLAARRKEDPAYTLAPDGIHPGALGHRLIAQQLREAWNAPAPITAPDPIDAPAAREFFKLVQERQNILSSAWLMHVGHNHPNKEAALPLDKAKKRAAALKKRIRELAKPIKTDSRPTPAG